MQPNEPRGIDLLALLIDLLADQEGVKITYTICNEDGKCVRRTTGDKHP